jgi:hypothetical protein
MGKRLGLLQRRYDQNSGERNSAPRAGRTDSDGFCRGVLGVGTEVGKRAEMRWRHPAPFWEGAGEAGGGGGRETGLTHGGSRARAGGSLPTGGRRPAGNGLNSAGAGDVRHVRAAGRIEGEGRG